MAHLRIARASKVVFAAAVASTVLTVVLPVVGATPIARWWAQRASASHCGVFSVRRVELPWTTAFRLLAGRSLHVTLRTVTIESASHERVLWADRIDADIRLGLAPLRVASVSAVVERGGWRLAPEGETMGLTAAFRPLPREGRAACLAAEPAAPATETRLGTGPVRITAHLRDVDTVLDFASWGLDLGHASATGEVTLGGPVAPFLFDVRDVAAGTSKLRVGPPASRQSVTVPFDAVAIAHVGTATQSPTDLALDVRAAVTRRAVLAGRATFTQLFPVAGREPPPAGIDLDAHWSRLGDALSAGQGEWLPRGVWAEHLDGDLHATMRGPFSDLTSSVSLTTSEGTLHAHMAGQRATLRLDVTGAETDGMLDPALRPLLSGRLTGNLDASLELGESITAGIDRARLRVERDRARPGPRTITLGIGRTAATPASADVLAFAVAAVKLDRGVFRLDDARIAWPGIDGHGHATVALPAAGAPTDARSAIAADGVLNVDPGRWWRAPISARGPVRASARAHGTLERIRLGVRVLPREITAYGQAYRLPPEVRAEWTPSGGLAIASLSVAREGGGRLGLQGSLGPAGALEAKLTVRDHPLTALPGFAALPALPALDGRVDADLTVGGTLARPTVSGRLQVDHATVRNRALGELRAQGHLGRRRGLVTAHLGPGAVLTARITRAPRATVRLRLELDRQPVGAWLPAPLPALPLLASGSATLDYRKGRPVTTAGTFEISGPGGIKLAVSGRGSNRDLRSHVEGDIDLGTWAPFLRRYLTQATGTLRLDGTVASRPGFAGISGTAAITRDLVLGLPGWRVPLTVAAGGSVDLDGDDVSTAGLAVRSSGLDAVVSGHARLDRAALARSPVTLAISAAVDAERLPFAIPGTVAVAGHVLLDTQIAGTWADGPRIDGRARLDNVTVRLADRSLPRWRANGELDAHDNVVTTENLRIAAGRVGTVRVGTPGNAARAELASLYPLRLGQLDVPLAAEHLSWGGGSSGFRVADLTAYTRLAGDAREQLTLSGALSVAGASYDVGRARKSSPGPKAPWFRALPPWLTLDLDVRGGNRAFQVAVPVLPDFSFDFHCHVIASQRGVRASGSIDGGSLYARAALGLYDWLSDQSLDRCQLGSP